MMQLDITEVFDSVTMALISGSVVEIPPAILAVRIECSLTEIVTVKLLRLEVLYVHFAICF